MSDDTIRAALDAAQQALCDYMTSGDCRCRAGSLREPCAPTQEVIATIAAFLRAPGIDVEMMLSGTNAIAAAVEEAARHE